MNIPSHKHHDPPFSISRFIIIIMLTLIALGLIMRFVSPSAWTASVEAPLWKLLTVFLVAHLGTCFGEHAFHRYFLHSPFPLLRRLYRQHTLHHGLTNVKLMGSDKSEGKVFNRYPIESEEQHKASYFPWWSLSAFVAVALPIVIIPLQLLFPTWPVAWGIVLAITWGVVLYEIIHMIEHLPYETFWKSKIQHPRFGGFWKWFYCFHLRHHANVKLNENISGFFGIPLADFFFGTYAPWLRVYLDGEKVPWSEFEAPHRRPGLVIRMLDSLLLRV